MKYKLSISMPCYGRPLRTQRAIECIMSQDMTGWEAIIQGDGCPHFQRLIDTAWLEERRTMAEARGNKFYYANTTENHGGCGYKLTNAAIGGASGEYIIFMGNDDMITPTHFSHYYSYIKEAGYDYMYFNSYLDPIKAIRNTQFAPSQIGHSEIIVTSELARKAPLHTGTYGHDWEFIKYLGNNGKGGKADSPHTTYHVMSIPNLGTKDTID